MQVTYCDYCRERIDNQNELVTLSYNINGMAKFPCGENHFHVNCARKIKSYTDGFCELIAR